MKKFEFLSFLISRQFLAFLALIVFASLIWFLGPFVAFGGLKPLAEVWMRVLLIALLLTGVLLWLVAWSTSVVFVALLGLLIWYAAPLLSFGTVVPFAPISVRIGTIAVVVAVFVLFWMFCLWRNLRDDEEFLKKVLRFGRGKSQSPAAPRLLSVQASLANMLARLKSMRTGAGGVGKLFQGKRYLYELPWYLTLGAHGSGKTSALLNGGLSFPVAEQMQRAAGGVSSDAAAVEWWLTNEAVLIDTAGYYTRHGFSTSEDIDVGIRHDVDRAEWMGFLGLLRRHRPRTPINGALLTVDLATLVGTDEGARNAAAAALRARLADLRRELGIRFPVYLIITKMDRLTGFAEYFGALTAEGRAQPWGFTLPQGKDTVIKEGIRARCHEEFTRLAQRLARSTDTHLQDEYDTSTRRKLAALPEEFAALRAAIVELIDRVFLDSRYDDTQLHSTLRGVYFTSARQGGGELVSEARTVMQRLASAHTQMLTGSVRGETHNKSFFLHDLFRRIVLPEANLVSPNLRWEYRYRIVRLLGHTLALLLFVSLALGLRASFGNNSAYLDTMGAKVQALDARVAQTYKGPDLAAVPETLAETLALPSSPGLDLDAPAYDWRFGLYTPPSVVAASHHTYEAVEDNLLLPQIARRMEDALSKAMARKDTKSTYDTLRVYLMLHDKARFDAAEVRAWVLEDWTRTDSATVFGGRASMIEHVRHLFSGERIVQSPLVRDDALVQKARAFLDGSNATDRLYERAKAAMLNDEPDQFTLLRAVGPQAGKAFTRASGQPLSRGVPGLFTLEGYRELFDKRLAHFIRVARADDAWVMGRSDTTRLSNAIQAELPGEERADDALTEAVRREYLEEYTQQWDAFLNDIETVSGTSLAFNLQVLRGFAAPDSPLARLARAAVRETTLTQTVLGPDNSVLRRAGKQAAEHDVALPIHAAERIERELVDSRFAALREVVTGNADVQADGRSTSRQDEKTRLDGIVSLLNEYYTTLTVSDSALANDSMPPANDVAQRLKLTAETMPAPFRAVLLRLAADGSHEVSQGMGQLLSRQMQAMVGDTCRLAIDGNYPFDADSSRDVSVDDFTRVFAQGGVIDDFFVNTLAPYVDTAVKPWRYRILPGATEPVRGPDLEPFEHAKAIRDIFFNDSDHKQLAWKADIRIPELDPTITSLSVDIDGQTTLYQHGPVEPFVVTWPGPRGGVHAEITASPRIQPDTSTIQVDGPWAMLRLMQKGRVIASGTAGRTRVAFSFDGREAALDISSPGSVANPLTSDVLSAFRCPSTVPLSGLTTSNLASAARADAGYQPSALQ
ncbi:type VI secretion system membrane subunit TssM [Bordetella sp. LUAb4]|uniref:type VI secretion system membrane subunit TssM n=1 Tax=Bordetella sp. LUAb4 TaxID=2843195 RepID=UPI001E5A19F7|nr:type VI secretion system membrane subunit TssM [Bordetella sp. LUAb4]